MAKYTTTVPSGLGAGGSGLFPRGGDPSPLVAHVQGIQTALNASDDTASAIAAKAALVGSVGWNKEVPCPNAATVFAEFPVHVAKAAGTVLGVALTSADALVAHAANYVTITVARRRAGVSATIATFVSTPAPGGTGDWVAWVPIEAAVGNASIVAGDIITMVSTKSGAGVICPAWKITVTFS